MNSVDTIFPQVQEFVDGPPNPDRVFSSQNVESKRLMFEMVLEDLKIDPYSINNVLVMAAGKGAEVIAAKDVFPNSSIVAVGLENLDIYAKDDNRVTFNQTQHSEFIQNNPQLVKIFDIVTLVNSGEKHQLDDPINVDGLSKMLSSQGVLITMGDNNNLELSKAFGECFKPHSESRGLKYAYSLWVSKHKNSIASINDKYFQ